MQRARQRVHNLQKEIAYWNEKCLKMRVGLQRLELESGEVMESKEAANKLELTQLQQQINERLRELKNTRKVNEVLKRQLQSLKNEKEMDTKADTGSLVKAAMAMTPAELQLVNYQVLSLIHICRCRRAI
eukprot:TRINITY_DN14786_c0_g1_i13.p2 TRINITY_DN14786_c0_g1~~TRINITY_DN14786_c0_g1_i13.p2  ORF type:complete len:130 (+),score=48.81 TRINITY_DN14786_c0_g1_i13:70-459(+)